MKKKRNTIPGFPSLYGKKRKKGSYGGSFYAYPFFANGIDTTPTISNPGDIGGTGGDMGGGMGEDTQELQPPILGNEDEFSRSKDEDETAESVHEFSCAMLNLTPAVTAIVSYWIRKNIPEKDLYINEESGHDGYEETPHVTVKYGIHDEEPNKLSEILDGYGPVVIKLGKVSKFEHDDYDVIKVDVESDVLRELNKVISEGMEVTDTHKDYIPHVTLAYVKKGNCDSLIGNDFFSMLSDEIGEVCFSSKNGDEYFITLELE